MTTFFLIIFAILLSLLIIFLIIFLFIKYKLRNMINEKSAEPNPLSININEDLIAEWKDTNEVATMIEDLKLLGYKEGKAYTIKQMEGVKLFNMYAPESFAVIYQHPQAGNWVDLIADTNHGLEICCSNAMMGEEIETADYCKKVHLKDASITEVFEALQLETQSHDLTAVRADDFRSRFENSYKKEVMWRNRNGGVSVSEFKKIAVNNQIEISDENILEAFINSKVAELNQWNDAAITEYLDISPSREYAYNDLFIVPEVTDPSAFIHYLDELEVISIQQVDLLVEKLKKQNDIPLLFDTLNNGLSPELRAIKVSEIVFPVKSTIYQTKNL
ncbi:hypothetical protein [Shewanella sp. 10N.286.48.B5]|uniref:hypothetical protein n=1 Tax=Shewanella sp. 10N.286.48.B5 TaxID=1880834 RepID=UPI0039A4F993